MQWKTVDDLYFVCIFVISILTSLSAGQYMQKKNPLYSQLKEETVWSIEQFNNYVNENFTAKGLAKDWVHGAFTVS